MLSYPQYGVRETYEPVIEELLASCPLQRLRGIHQLGVVHFIDPAWSTKRYEHSLGVLMLLRKFGASIEEQVAGLLHDVSHTAFSHVADFLFERWNSEGFGEEHTREWVCKGELAEILRRYNIEPSRVVDHDQFSLLEQPKPDLCADRLDYSCRDAVSFGLLTIDDAKAFIDDLAVHDGRFVFKTPSSAAAFARLFIVLDRDYYASPSYMASYFLMVAAMKAGFTSGALVMDDLWKDDEHVMRLLMASDQQDVLRPLRVLTGGFAVDLQAKDPSHTLRKKVRYVDPFVLQNGELVRISHIDPSVKREIALYLEQRRSTISFSIIDAQTCQPVLTN